MAGDLAEGARDDLGVDSAAFNLGQKGIDFAIADKRIAPNEGDMKRLVLVDQGEYARDEIIATEVGEIPEPGLSAEMRVVERVASRAS